MWEHTNLDDTEEVLTLFFIAKDIVKGTRAVDDFFLDWADMEWVEGTTTQSPGWKIKHVASKNNREGYDRPIGLPCITGCCGEISRDAAGGWVKGRLCPAHLGKHAKLLQARDACVPCEELECAVFASVKPVRQVPSGTTLVRSAQDSIAHEAKAFVLVVTAEQEASGVVYDGSQPFTYEGRSFRPPARGVWFEVPGKGYAVHAHGAAAGMTYRMRKLMYKTNRRAGSSVIPVADVEKTSTRSLRIAMATLLKRANVPMAEIVENGEWEDEEMARTYIRQHDPLAAVRRNLPDAVLGGQAVPEVAGEPQVAATSALATAVEAQTAALLTAAAGEAQTAVARIAQAHFVIWF